MQLWDHEDRIHAGLVPGLEYRPDSYEFVMTTTGLLAVQDKGPKVLPEGQCLPALSRDVMLRPLRLFKAGRVAYRNLRALGRSEAFWEWSENPKYQLDFSGAPKLLATYRQITGRDLKEALKFTGCLIVDASVEGRAVLKFVELGDEAALEFTTTEGITEVGERLRHRAKPQRRGDEWKEQSLDVLVALEDTSAENEMLSASMFEREITPVFEDLRRIHGDYLEMFEGTHRELRSLIDSHVASMTQILSGVNFEAELERFAPYGDAEPEPVDGNLLAMKAALGLASDHETVGIEVIRGLRAIADNLFQRRANFEAIRVELRALSALSRLHQDPGVQRFITAVVAYFPTGGVSEGDRASIEPTCASTVFRRVIPSESLLTAMKIAAAGEALEGALSASRAVAPGPDPFELKSLPRTWKDLQTDVETVLAHQRASWEVVCGAYAELRVRVYGAASG
jgi:hypothetical protein